MRRLAGYGAACYARNGDLLRHVSTADTARDLDLLGGALGQPKLNFMGLSYGTYLGATYANLFPSRVGRTVLDGNIAPSAWTNGRRPDASESFSMREGSATEVVKTLAAFLRICRQRGTQDCGFSAGNPAKTTAKWTALLARLRRGPVTVDATTYTYTQLVTLVRNLLFFVQPLATPAIGAGSPGWPGAAALLQDLWTARNTNRAPPRPRRHLWAARPSATPGSSSSTPSSAVTRPALPPLPTPACSAACSAAGHGRCA
jgi:pimeloyl-ACP methyl ester carboxylesterase